MSQPLENGTYSLLLGRGYAVVFDYRCLWPVGRRPYCARYTESIVVAGITGREYAGIQESSFSHIYADRAMGNDDGGCRHRN